MPFDPSDYSACAAAYKSDTADISGVTVLADDSGRGNTATMSSAPTLAAGKIGQAILYDGSIYAALPTIPGINTTAAAAVGITLAAWVKTSNTSSSMVILGSNAGSSVVASLWLDCNNSGFGSYSAGKVSGGLRLTNGYGVSIPPYSAAINDGQWHHVCLTVAVGASLSAAVLYVDGASVATATGTFSGFSSFSLSPSLYLGANSTGSAPDQIFDGLIDDARIYASLLSSPNAAALAAYAGAPSGRPQILLPGEVYDPSACPRILLPHEVYQ